jgi:hypothetical protein
MSRQPASKKLTPSPLLLTGLPTSELPISKLPMSKPMRKFLGQLTEDPSAALRNRRRHTPAFCRRYFDLCEAGALECDRSVLEHPELVLDPSRIAILLAEKSGDRHLVNRSLGVLAHAHLAIEQQVEAFEVLESYRSQAMHCCSSCKADWWRRWGDYLVEIKDGSGAHETLSRCLHAADNLDEAGRIGFVHGISYYFLGRQDAAIENEFRVLERLDLSSPRGYFLDALAMLAVFLRGATPEHDRRVLHRLGLFRIRIQHVRDWGVVRVCLRWIEGQLLARLGDMGTAIERLDIVRRYLLEHGPVRQAVAVTLDLCLIYCRHADGYGENYRTVKSMIRVCWRLLPEEATGEEAMLRAGLGRLLEVLEDNPEEQTFDALVDLRSSFMVPVRGIVAERLGGGRRIVLVRDVMANSLR